jgi:hypothetical protein
MDFHVLIEKERYRKPAPDQEICSSKTVSIFVCMCVYMSVMGGYDPR